MPTSTSTAQAQAVRGFNRFYTQRIGVLAPYLGSKLSLAEARVLYELAHRHQPAASELVKDLQFDAGYLSRILRRFETWNWVRRTPSPDDGRQSLLQLTDEGRSAFEPLQRKSLEHAEGLLATLPRAERARLISAMRTVQNLLDPGSPPAARTVILRDPGPGDLGWVIQQHGEVYAREYGYGSDFEALVAEIAATILRDFDPALDKGWIAELDGDRVGSVFVVHKEPGVAQLRLLILSAHARGLGLGGRLVDECIGFARSSGYVKLVLWTNGQLDAARAIYASRGFRRTSSEPLHAHGQELVSETWELALE